MLIAPGLEMQEQFNQDGKCASDELDPATFLMVVPCSLIAVSPTASPVPVK